MTTTSESPVALVTGGSRGLGHALVSELVRRGWQVITDGRDAERLARSVSGLAGSHRRSPATSPTPATAAALAAAVRAAGRLDLLVNNASVLGPLVPLEGAAAVGAARRVRGQRRGAAVAGPARRRPAASTARSSTSRRTRRGSRTRPGVAMAPPRRRWTTSPRSSGASGQDLRVYAFDPGDMATDLQQQAFPGEDVSDRPSPESVVPSLLAAGRGAAGRVAATPSDTLVPA